MKYATYHQTLGSAVSEIHSTLADSRNDVRLTDPDAFINVYQFDGISYGKTKEAHAQIATHKGKPTKKYAHASIYRMDSGRYELTLYVA
jgi:hypothetical protein